jgi:RecB family endonuclease NucS
MLAGAALRKTGSGWEFTSESALEDFVWAKLHLLFGLTPLARQHSSKGEYCDILAVNKTKQLTIIELKNIEDRYIVQQLTRYYDNLLETKPFADKIDYNQPVKLIAIAPSFHRYNHIDRKYNKLKIEFLTVAVIPKNQDFYLQLIDIDTSSITKVKIPYQILDVNTTSTSVLPPPQLLLDWLGTCSSAEQQAILKMREKILAFDTRIKEEREGKNTIKYSGKSKIFAELCFQRKINKPVIFLWLPTPSSLFGISQEIIGRLRLWIDNSKVTHVGHIPEGFGKMRLESEWNAMSREQRPRNLMHSLSYKSFSPVDIFVYERAIANPQSLDSLVDLAISKWLSRISNN